MRRIDTSFAAGGQPFTAPTSLDMLQDAYKDGIRELALAQIGSSYSASVPYILWGCESVSPVAVSEGGIFFNGEVFYTAGWSSGSLPPSPLVLIANISTNFAAIDPVTFEDGTTHNVHELRTCIFAYGTSGTGTIGDFTDFVRVNTTSYSRVNVAAAISSPTIALDRNRIITYNNTSATTTITLDDTKAISGREVYINCAVANIGDSITFSGSYLIVNQTDPFIVANATQVLIKIKTLETGSSIFTSFVEIYNPA
jgi:hypothetical protein